MTALIVVLALIALAAVCVAYACVIAGARADRLSDNFEIGAGHSPLRSDLRDVGGPTAGTCQPRPPRGGCEAGAHGRAGAAQDAPVRRPPDISSP